MSLRCFHADETEATTPLKRLQKAPPTLFKKTLERAMATTNMESTDIVTDISSIAPEGASRAASEAYERSAQTTFNSPASDHDSSLDWLPSTQFFDSTAPTTAPTKDATIWPVNQSETQEAAAAVQSSMYDSWIPSLTSKIGWTYDLILHGAY